MKKTICACKIEIHLFISIKIKGKPKKEKETAEKFQTRFSFLCLNMICYNLIRLNLYFQVLNIKMKKLHFFYIARLLL